MMALRYNYYYYQYKDDILGQINLYQTALTTDGPLFGAVIRCCLKLRAATRPESRYHGRFVRKSASPPDYMDWEGP